MLEISEIGLAEPYGDIRIAADGTVNLGRVRKNTATPGNGDVANGQADNPVPADTGETESTASGGTDMSVTIGHVTIANAAADFEDLSLPH